MRSLAREAVLYSSGKSTYTVLDEILEKEIDILVTSVKQLCVTKQLNIIAQKLEEVSTSFKTKVKCIQRINIF